MRSVLLIVLLLKFSVLNGQEFNYRVNKEVRFAYDITQGKYGNIFISTSKGLLEYNGSEFILHNKENALITDFVRTVSTGFDNTLWFTYYHGGFGRINNNTFYNFPVDVDIYDILELKNKSTYFSTSQGLYKYENSGLEKIIQEDLESFDILETTPEGLLLAKSTFENLWVKDENSDHFYLIQENIQFLTTNIESEYFLTIQKDTLFVEKLIDGGLSIPGRAILTDYGIVRDEISNITFRGNKILLATHDQGVFTFSFNKKNEVTLLNQHSKKTGLASENIQSVYIDHEGNYWFGSFGDGTFLLPKNTIIHHKLGDNSEESNVRSIIEYDDEILLGTNAGIISFTGEKNPDFSSLKESQIKCLNIINDTLLIGTDKGLYLYAEDVLTPVKLNEKDQPSVNFIAKEKERIHVATNEGLYVLNNYNSPPQQITTNEGLVHNIIEHLEIGKDGTIWFTSPNSPITNYNNGELAYFKDIPEFQSFNAVCVKEMSNGDIYIATQGDGVLRYRDGIFEQFDVLKGLYSDYIYFIEETPTGQIVCGHANSISFKSLKDSTFRNAGTVKLLNYINNNVTFFSEKGSLLAGTSFGVVEIPDLLSFINDPIPDLHISGTLVNGKKYTDTNKIVLTPGNYFFEFNFKAKRLTNVNAVSYYYMLKGFDKQWTHVEYGQEQIYYQSLSTGEYEFIVELALNGVKTNKRKQIKIVIAPPFWQTPLFFILLVIGLVLIFISILRVITIRNRHLRNILNTKVQQRTETIRKKNQEIVHINQDLLKLSEQYLDKKNRAEKQTEELTKSIHYAHRIQKIIFRKNEYVEWISIFKDSFLLFKPKDIVSGDFYWGHKKNNKYYVCIADCTGHGVPGAMISMLGLSILNEIILHYDHPNEILDRLRERIIIELTRGEETDNSKDGMDIALICYDPKEMTIDYSGAYNPITIIRKKEIGFNANEGLKVVMETPEHQTLLTVPDRQPIGYYFEMHPFTLTKIKVYSGDYIILNSDGYTDQFGGSKNKKFMRKRLFSLLNKIYDLPGEKQKEILWNELQAWMGENDQIDDISLMGIKI